MTRFHRRSPMSRHTKTTCSTCSMCSMCSAPRKSLEDHVPASGHVPPHGLRSRCSTCSAKVDFDAVNRAAQSQLLSILARWLPGGRLEGHEYVALNPRRADNHLGSFKVNIRNGKWADFATRDRGGDVVSLMAYLFGLSQSEAARRLAGILGLPGAGGHHG